MENNLEQTTNPAPAGLSEAGFKHLSETRKWTLFISILGFIFIGIFIFIFLILMLMRKFGPEIPFAGLTFIPLFLMLILYFFPIYFLFQFSRFGRKAVANKDHELLATALRYLKLHYRFMGIVLIIVVAIYIFLFFFMMVSGTLFGLFGSFHQA